MVSKSEEFRQSLNKGQEKLLDFAGDKLTENPKMAVQGLGKTATELGNTVKHAVRTVVEGVKASVPLVNTGIGVASGIAGILTWMVAHGFFDNSVIDRFEKHAKDKGKNNPYGRALVTYYVLLTMVLGGAGFTTYSVLKSRDKDDDNDPKAKKEVVIDAPKTQEYILEESSFEDIESQSETKPDANIVSPSPFEEFQLDPLASDEQWNAAIEAIHPYVIANVLSHEGFFSKIYNDNGKKGKKTMGMGFTIEDREHIRVAERVLGRKLENNTVITRDEARRVSDAWLLETIYPNMRSVLCKPVSSRLFVALAIASYHSGQNTYILEGNSGRPVIRAINDGKSLDEIIDAYIKAFAQKRGTGYKGAANKYAILAMYAMGKISNETVLNGITEAPYTVGELVLEYQKKNGLTDANTYAEKRLITYSSSDEDATPTGFFMPPNIEEMLLATTERVTFNEVQIPVHKAMSEHEVATILSGELFATDVHHIQAIDPKVKESKQLNAEGLVLYEDGKYGAAVKKFKEAIKKDPANYDAYGNLTIAYYKTGKYKEVVELVQKMDNNEDLPEYIKANGYYNAAMACRELGNDAHKKKTQQEYYKQGLEFLDKASELSGKEYPILNGELKDALLNSEGGAKKLSDAASVSRESKFNAGRKTVQGRANIDMLVTQKALDDAHKA